MAMYFIICAENLGSYVNFMSTQKGCDTFSKLTKDIPNVSYLMFTDDRIIFYGQLNKPKEMLNTSWIIIVKYRFS